jgi:predicted small metal-binding protein
MVPSLKWHKAGGFKDSPSSDRTQREKGKKESVINRKYIDCRDYPGDIKCSVALSADTDEELLEAVVQHGTQVHGYSDTPEFRQKIRKEFKEGRTAI